MKKLWSLPLSCAEILTWPPHSQHTGWHHRSSGCRRTRRDLFEIRALWIVQNFLITVAASRLTDHVAVLLFYSNTLSLAIFHSALIGFHWIWSYTKGSCLKTLHLCSRVKCCIFILQKIYFWDNNIYYLLSLSPLHFSWSPDIDKRAAHTHRGTFGSEEGDIYKVILYFIYSQVLLYESYDA